MREPEKPVRTQFQTENDTYLVVGISHSLEDLIVISRLGPIEIGDIEVSSSVVAINVVIIVVVVVVVVVHVDDNLAKNRPIRVGVD
jgi:hypothetical protein